MLEVAHLNKTYQDFSLKDVSFKLQEGCITGFIGINGAGKTTTLKTLLKLTKRDSGTIHFFNMDIDTHEREIKDKLGIIIDDGGFYDALTLTEMKSIIAPAYSNWCEADFKNYLVQFNLNPKQKISTLSKGMRMKYALALALSHKAELLIMDEPTSGLDPLIRSEVLTILREYMDTGNGKGVFFSTHITSDLDKIADMLIMIDNGKIIFQEDKDSLLEKYRIVKGDCALINETNKNLFIKLKKNAFNFVGITDKANQVKQLLPDALFERPTIEDIMLAHIRGGHDYDSFI